MPAKLIADALQETGFSVQFLGSGRRLEEEIFGPAGYEIHTVQLGGLNKVGVFGTLKFLLQFPSALCGVFSLLSKIRPAAIVGVGGYASVLPVVVGALRGYPTWIHEAELSPGNANRFLAHFAKKISVAFEETTEFPSAKKVYTGHPIRPDVAALAGSGPQHCPPRNILVLGGSQGAKAIDDAFFELAPRLQERGFHLFHQCRPESREKLVARYQEVELEAIVESFVHELGEAYKWSDLIVCRAGAGTVMEIGVVNRPTILVPFPHAQGKHQHRNAETLTNKGKALMVEEGENFSERLWDQISKLSREGEFSKMRSLPPVFRPTDAAFRIAEGVRALTANC